MSVLVFLLIPELGNSDYKVREVVTSALRGMEAASTPALLKACKSPDPEVAFRASILLKPWKERSAAVRSCQVRPASWRKLPWLHLGGCYGSDATRHWVTMAHGAGWADTRPRWEAYREATRLWVEYMLAKGLSVLDELERMRIEEFDWTRDNFDQ